MSQDVAAALARAPTCFTGCLNGNGQETQPRVDAGTLTAVCNTQAALIGAVPSNVNAVSAFSNCVANACTPSALDSIPAWQAANRPLLVTYCLASASPLSSSRASGTGTVSAAGTATTTRAFVSTLATLAPAIPDGGSTSDPLVPIIAGVGGGLAGLAILTIGVYCLWHRKRELARLKALAKRLSRTSRTQSQARETLEAVGFLPADIEATVPNIVITEEYGLDSTSIAMSGRATDGESRSSVSVVGDGWDQARRYSVNSTGTEEPDAAVRNKRFSEYSASPLAPVNNPDTSVEDMTNTAEARASSSGGNKHSDSSARGSSSK
ncbi:hypothetical protein BJ741DRAFT_621944 [Chytriomyces cf. hyalinus JEL632]|nr:hypothetical protein BJ741DRAFT_621944 [Chytriomyces cf. hyalinus JEL632]